MRPFTFIDLFAGIGGFHVGMSKLGGKCVFSCEIDAACQDVYENNFASRPYPDIRVLTEGKNVDVPAHDVLCAGFPCQPFSKSGRQLGMNETRGTLFFNILKILEARRPRYIVLENVRNLAGPRQKHTWEVVIRNLWKLGYRVSYEPAVFSPHLLPPEKGGRPQVRERVFILGSYKKEGASDIELNEPVRLHLRPFNGWKKENWRIEDWLENEGEIQNPKKYSLKKEETRWIEAWNDFIQMIDEDPLPGFPIWADVFLGTYKELADMPDWEINFIAKNKDFYSRHKSKINRWTKRHKVEEFPFSRRKFEWQARGWPRDLWKLVMHFRPSGIRVKGPTYLPALVAITQTSIIGSRKRKITPREAARLQGFPDDFVLHEDDKIAYKQLGNAVNVGVVQYAASCLMEK